MGTNFLTVSTLIRAAALRLKVLQCLKVLQYTTVFKSHNINEKPEKPLSCKTKLTQMSVHIAHPISRLLYNIRPESGQYSSSLKVDLNCCRVHVSRAKSKIMGHVRHSLIVNITNEKIFMSQKCGMSSN